ncbi:MAG: Hsp20/alpha crystallin family protein [Ignavibacteriaceae bacterium]|nr:Hsp20/alpha crystallin family protein [Ignavibacteriaceae bacterium]
MNENKEIINIKENQNRDWDTVLETEISFAPLVDIYETDDDFMLIANMPGVKRDGVQVKLDDGTLVIFGKINYGEVVKRKYILNESEIGNYYRKFKISNNIDVSKIDASYENGQLVVRLPKHERVKPITIEIK